MAIDVETSTVVSARHRVRIGLLGPLEVESDGRPVYVAGTHRRRILALLASQAGHGVSTGAIVDALWGDNPPPSAIKTVQSHMARLRRSLEPAGADLIRTTRGGYLLEVPPECLDTERFVGLARAARDSLSSGDERAACELFTEAAALWRGPAYGEFLDGGYARIEAVHLEEIRLAVAEGLAESQILSGSAAAAIPALERLVREDPGRETGWALLMQALYSVGRQHDALDAFNRARRALADEFGLEVGAQLRELERQILAQELTVSGTATLAAALRAAGPMIGRSQERERLVATWASACRGSGQMLLISGPIDTGRTRLIADIAGIAVGGGHAVEYIRASDGLAAIAHDSGQSLIDAVVDRTRRGPLLLAIDDVEWLQPSDVPTLAALAGAADALSLLLMVTLDPSGGGTVVNTVQRLAAGSALELGPMSDAELADLVVMDGCPRDVAAAVVAVAGGLPGAARREAAAWTERTAGERLRAAASKSLHASEEAERAQDSMLDEVLELVAARARRDSLRSATWAGRQPFRALASYGPQDAELFVGRERLVAELAALVLDRRLAVVVGPSGSGKSSLVNAGLVPLVRSGRLPGGAWRANVVHPGRDPFAALAAVRDLDEPGCQLLVVDQFEEIFTGDATTAEAFAVRLAALAGDQALAAHVVVAVRADAYPSLTALPALAALAKNAQLLVGPPSEQELRRIVEEPARRTGVDVETQIADLVADELSGNHAALPLLSAAMAELWERRDGSVLRASQFAAMGGVAASVERIGEGVTKRLGDDRLQRLRAVLVGLADLTEDDVWQRRQVDVETIATDDRDVLTALVDARLVARDESTVEIVHEIVFQAWPRLASWLDAARSDKQLERELRVLARAWDEQDRSDDGVVRGTRLDAALEWSDRPGGAVSPLVHAMLEASVLHREAEQHQAAEQLAARTRSNRRLRRLLVATAVLLVLAMTAAIVAVAQRNRADSALDRERHASAEAVAQRDVATEQRDIATEQRSLADDQRQLAIAERDRARGGRLIAESRAQLDSHPDLAMLLAVEAWTRQQSNATRGAMLATLTNEVSADVAATALGGARDLDGGASLVRRSTSQLLGFMHAALDMVWQVSISEDGSVAAVAGKASTGNDEVELFDVRSRRMLGRVTAAAPDRVLSVDLSPDGTRLVVVHPDRVELVDVSSRGATQVGPSLTEPARALFSGDGRLIMINTLSGRLSAWDGVTADAADVALPSLSAGDPGISITDDGLLRYVDGNPPAMVLWDIGQGREVRRTALEAPSDGIWPNRWVLTPDRLTLAGVQNYFGLVLWDAATGRLLPAPPTPGRLSSVVIDPIDPSLLLLGSFSGRLVLYDHLQNRVIGRPLREQGAKVADVSAARGAGQIVSVSSDGLITLWGDNAGPGLIDRPLSDDAWSAHIAGGNAVVLTDGGKAAEIRDASALDRAGTPITAPPGTDDWTYDVSHTSADGTAVLSLLEAPSGSVAFVVDGRTGDLKWSDERSDVAWTGISADGRFVALAGGQLLRVVDVASGSEVARFVDTGGGFYGAPVFDDDDRHLDIVTHNGPRRFDLDDPSTVVDLQQPVVSQGTLAQVPGTDDVVAVGGEGGVLTRWDMSTGAVVASGRSSEASNFLHVVISPDGTTIAALHYITGTMSLFDAATMEEIGTISAAESQKRVPQLTEDDRLIGDGVTHHVTEWDIDPSQWQAAACHAAGRNLTEVEWSQYVGDDEPYRQTCIEWPTAV